MGRARRVGHEWLQRLRQSKRAKPARGGAAEVYSTTAAAGASPDDDRQMDGYVLKKCQPAKPGSSLSNWEKECTSNCMSRFLDSKRFLMERLQEKGKEQQQNSGMGGF